MKSIVVFLIITISIVVDAFPLESDSFVFPDALNVTACTTVDNLQCQEDPSGNIPFIRKSEENCHKYNPKTGRQRIITKRGIVVGGISADIREFPFMAALGWTNEDGVDFFAVGSLISESYILTTAHSTFDKGRSFDVARIGVPNIRNDAQPDVKLQTFGVSEIICHPNYTRSSFYNDIALVKLSQPVEFTGVRPVCLKNIANIKASEVTALGYGDINGIDSTSIGTDFVKVTLSTTTLEVCAERYSDKSVRLKDGIVETQLCAGDSKGEKDVCQGNSGGPLMDLTSDPPRLIGVMSFGRACPSLGPNVYSRVSSYVDWIESIVWK